MIVGNTVKCNFDLFNLGALEGNFCLTAVTEAASARSTAKDGLDKADLEEWKEVEEEGEEEDEEEEEAVTTKSGTALEEALGSKEDIKQMGEIEVIF